MSKPDVFHAVHCHAAAAIQSVTGHAALQPAGSPEQTPSHVTADKTCLEGNAAVGMLDASCAEPTGGGACEHQAPTEDAATAPQDMQHTPHDTLASRQPAEIPAVPALGAGKHEGIATEDASGADRIGSTGAAPDTFEGHVTQGARDAPTGDLGRIVPRKQTVLPKLPSAEELQPSDCKAFNIGASFLFQTDSAYTLSVLQAHACT